MSVSSDDSDYFTDSDTDSDFFPWQYFHIFPELRNEIPIQATEQIEAKTKQVKTSCISKCGDIILSWLHKLFY